MNRAAAVITSADMTVAVSTVGAIPKVDGLTPPKGMRTRSWTFKRGLQNFLIELTEDPTGQTGWVFAANSRKSSATLKRLTSGKRY
jgi:hypothetical protein